MKKSFFITLEGIEGAGKTTLIDFIEDLFINNGRDVVKTREPGGTTIGEQIRKILLNNENKSLSHDTELLLLFAARAQHMDEVIIPALSSGKIVICDRFTDASYAYQGGGRGIDKSRIMILEKLVQEDLKPDVTLLFDLDSNTGLQRTMKRNNKDRFENEKIEFFEKVRSCYLDLANKEPERFYIINSEKSIENVKEQINKIINNIVC